jgi:phage nucleotide-binding protein
MAKIIPSRQPRSAQEVSALTARVRGRIKRASKLPRRQRFLIYGEPGTRKTRLASSAPSPLIIDINDQGYDSVRNDYDPRYYLLDRWDDLNDVYWYLQGGDHDFETVVVDHVTNLQNICMNFVLGDEASRDASRDPDMPSRQAWGKVGQLMKTQIINFRNLPMNVVFLAHVRSNEIEAEDSETYIKLTPEVSPQVQKVLTGAVGTIGMMTKKEVWVKNKEKGTKRREVRTRLMFGDSERYVSKDRNNVFGEYIDAPDLTEMIELIYNGKEASSG